MRIVLLKSVFHGLMFRSFGDLEILRDDIAFCVSSQFRNSVFYKQFEMFCGLCG